MSAPRFEIEVKRFYLPGLDVRVECPNCKRTVEVPGDGHYLSYPPANAPFTHTVWCSDCEHEWPIKLLLTVKLEVVP